MTWLSRRQIFTLLFVTSLCISCPTRTLSAEKCWEDVFKIPTLNHAGISKELKAEDIKGGIRTRRVKYDYYTEKQRVAKTRKLRVMSWNIQMAGPDIFVPAKDQAKLKQNAQWYAKLWNEKLYYIAKTILLREPDVLFLNEVSHEGMSHLMEAVFKPLGYTQFHFDREGRTIYNGMGNAVVVRGGVEIDFSSIETHATMINDIRPDTRNILKWKVRVGGKKVTFLGVHLKSRVPSTYRPPGLEGWAPHYVRQQQALKLKKLVEESVRAGEDVVILGDFNAQFHVPDESVGPDLQHRIAFENQRFQNMETDIENRDSITSVFQVEMDARRAELNRSKFVNGTALNVYPHDPFAEHHHPTFVFHDWIQIPGSTNVKPNSYLLRMDHILIVPGEHVIEAAQDPTVVSPNYLRNTYGDPKSSWFGISQERYAEGFFGPSDHWPIDITLHINAED